MQKAKTVAQSRTEQIQILMPQHINGYKRLFGGVLMEWIDVVAGVVARRHSNSEVTTASVDNLQFKSPAYVNSTIILVGTNYLCRHLLYGGSGGNLCRISLGRSASWLTGPMLLWLRSTIRNVPVRNFPRIIPETEEEKAEYEAGKRRHALRKQRRMENF